MKIVKPTFESLLEELEDIFIRIDDNDGIRSLVAGGINRNGIWTEFPTELEANASLRDITRNLKILVYLIQEEKKKWGLEKPHHFLIREMGMHLN